MTDLAIDVQGLVKNYGTERALDGLDLRIPRGVLAGFIGLNGAGKSTTFRILLHMARADSGSARVLGFDAQDRLQSLEIRSRTGFVPEGKALFPYMRVGEVVAFTKSLYPKWRGDLEATCAREFGLRYDRRIPELSKGTLSKLQLLLALCRGSELILLDEPTDGLDPLGVEVVMQSLVGLVAEEGITVLFSSHRLEEVEQLADHLCIIHRGRLLLDGASDDLKQSCRRVSMVFEGDVARFANDFAAAGPVRRDGRTLSVLVRSGGEEFAVRARQLGARSVEVQPVALKEMFLELVRGEVR
jgi:ABC-2 type transport system ATP-binding protein